MAFPTVAATNGLSDSANGTSHAVPLAVPGGGILANDIQLIVAGIDGTSAITPPDGTWNEILDASVGSTPSARAGAWWKRMSGGETGTITFTTASEGGGWNSYCIRGAHLTEAPVVSSVVNGAATANIGNPPSLDPAGWATEDTLWIAGMVVDGNNNVTAAPTNYTNLQARRWANTAGACVATAERTNAVSAEDPGTFTHGAGQHGAFVFAIRPLAPVGVDLSARLLRTMPLAHRYWVARQRRVYSPLIYSRARFIAPPAASATVSSSVSGGGGSTSTAVHGVLVSSSVSGGGASSSQAAKGGSTASSVSGGGGSTGAAAKGATAASAVSGGGDSTSTAAKSATTTSAVSGGGGSVSEAAQTAVAVGVELSARLVRTQGQGYRYARLIRRRQLFIRRARLVSGPAVEVSSSVSGGGAGTSEAAKGAVVSGSVSGGGGSTSSTSKAATVSSSTSGGGGSTGEAFKAVSTSSSTTGGGGSTSEAAVSATPVGVELGFRVIRTQRHGLRYARLRARRPPFISQGVLVVSVVTASSQVTGGGGSTSVVTTSRFTSSHTSGGGGSVSVVSPSIPTVTPRRRQLLGVGV